MTRFSTLHGKLAALIALVLVVTTVLPTLAQGPITYASIFGDESVRGFDEAVVALWNTDRGASSAQVAFVGRRDFADLLRGEADIPVPDIVTWYGGQQQRDVAADGMLLDLSPAWDTGGFERAFLPAFRNLSREVGERTFLPTNYTWYGIYYRPSLFQRVGVAAPLATWDDLLAACDTFNAVGLTPFAIGTAHRWPAAIWFDYLDLRLNGPAFHSSLMQLNASYLSREMRAVFSTWGQLFEHNCFGPNPADLTYRESLDLLADNAAAMTLTGDYIRDVYPAELQDDLDFFAFPVIDPAVAVGEIIQTDGFVVPASASNPRVALEMVAFLGSLEVQQFALDNFGQLPTRVDVDMTNAGRFEQQGYDLVAGAEYAAQLYDRDTDPLMVETGLEMFVAFWQHPEAVERILNVLENERLLVLDLRGRE